MTPQELARLVGRPGKTLLGQQFFSYSTGRLAAIAVAGGTINSNLTIIADSDFMVEKMTYNADLAGAAQTDSSRVVPNVSVQMTNTGNGAFFQSAAMPLSALFGTGQLPFILPVPMVLIASSTLQITLISFEAVSTPLLTLNFIGRKLYWN